MLSLAAETVLFYYFFFDVLFFIALSYQIFQNYLKHFPNGAHTPHCMVSNLTFISDENLKM